MVTRITHRLTAKAQLCALLTITALKEQLSDNSILLGLAQAATTEAEKSGWIVAHTEFNEGDHFFVCLIRTGFFCEEVEGLFSVQEWDFQIQISILNAAADFLKAVVKGEATSDVSTKTSRRKIAFWFSLLVLNALAVLGWPNLVLGYGGILGGAVCAGCFMMVLLNWIDERFPPTCLVERLAANGEHHV